MKLFGRKRAGRLGLLSDIAMVGAAALRVARKPASGSGRSAGAKARPMELLLVAGAAWRILGRVRQVRRDRRAGRAAS